jgi:hypothetical protein
MWSMEGIVVGIGDGGEKRIQKNWGRSILLNRENEIKHRGGWSRRSIGKPMG